MIFQQILLIIGVAIFGYLMGSIPTAVIVSKTFFRGDIRDYGSHNAGGTNVGRVMGKKYGVLVIALDMLKTIVTIWTTYLLLRFTVLGDYIFGSQPEWYYYGVSLFVSLGHCFPVFAQFRGGKAVSTYSGAILSTSWLASLIAGIVFFATLKGKKYVSLSSIIGSITGTIASALIFVPKVQDVMMWPGMAASYPYLIIMVIQTLIVIVRHERNLKRLQEGNENKIKWMK